MIELASQTPLIPLVMPATFDSFGIKFLYPDNWSVMDRGEDEGNDGVTFELPSGGFFTIEREHQGELTGELLEGIADSMEEEYGTLEREDFHLDDAPEDERAVEFRFYYLDLLIISRVVVMKVRDATYVVQMQAESRDFDSNEMVFTAILKQLRE